MKILLYSISSPHEITGIGKYNGELVEWLWDNGHEVDVMTSLPYYPYWEIYEGYQNEKFKVETYEKGHIYSTLLPVSKNVSSIRRVWIDVVFMLKTCFRLPHLSFKNEYVITILVLPPLSAFPIAIISKYFSRSKLHIHIQDFQIEAARELKLLPDLVLNVLEWLEKIFYRFADFITAISKNMADQVKKKTSDHSKKIEVLENWADTDTIKPIDDKSWLKKEYNYDDDTFLVVYSGNIGEKQGLDQLLYVAKDLEDYGDIQILILGDGAYKEKLLIESNTMGITNITFGSLVPKDKLNLMLNGSDVQLVLQSKYAADSFLPSKYVNILSAGVPSVVTAKKKTELYLMVTENSSSLLVQPENHSAITSSILKLYNNVELRETLSKNSRSFALEKFGRDMILNRLMKHYEEILN